mmetsp:Transcript_4786/g.10278  ORF Transcript_4786/g.10278 Transcript_4786/m.10278 type:complete len:325 (-) Transcript_4786:983-1957(-)
MKAGQALKWRVEHLDSPSFLFALFKGQLAPSVAKVFHKKLVPRLGTFLGEWNDDMVKQAMQQTMDDLEALNPSVSQPVSLVAALGMGDRVFVCGCGDAHASLARLGCSSPADGDSAIACLSAARDSRQGLLPSRFSSVGSVELGQGYEGLVLHCGGNVDAKILEPALDCFSGRPRAAGGAVLQHLSGPGAVCVAFFDAPLEAGLPEPASVRCKHIVLKFVTDKIKRPTDHARRVITRNQESAEQALRALLVQLKADPSTFSQLARSHSECPTALKGGDQSGDLGWIRRGRRPKNFEEAVFGLKVGDLSDIVVVENSAHIILRVA